MAKGNPNKRKSIQQIKELSQALQKIDLEARLIENMRHFQETSLLEPQKLKVYEVLLKTLTQVQRGQKICTVVSLRGDCSEDLDQSWRQKVELQRGAWTACALLVGAVIASTETCESWLHTYGLRIGVYLQMVEDLKKMKELNGDFSQSQNISNQISQELCSMLRQLRNDLSEASLAYQFLNDFGLQWSEIQEEHPH